MAGGAPLSALSLTPEGLSSLTLSQKTATRLQIKKVAKLKS